MPLLPGPNTANEYKIVQSVLQKSTKTQNVSNSFQAAESIVALKTFLRQETKEKGGGRNVSLCNPVQVGLELTHLQPQSPES